MITTPSPSSLLHSCQSPTKQTDLERRQLSYCPQRDQTKCNNHQQSCG